MRKEYTPNGRKFFHHRIDLFSERNWRTRKHTEAIKVRKLPKNCLPYIKCYILYINKYPVLSGLGLKSSVTDLNGFKYGHKGNHLIILSTQ